MYQQNWQKSKTFQELEKCVPISVNKNLINYFHVSRIRIVL